MIGFWFFMLAMTMLLPLTMVLLGKRFMYTPPKNINDFFGYRTTRSMRNRETWAFAHCCCGKFWWRVGWSAMAGTVLIMGFVFGKEIENVSDVGLILTFVQVILMIMALPVTEWALRREFD